MFFTTKDYTKLPVPSSKDLGVITPLISSCAFLNIYYIWLSFFMQCGIQFFNLHVLSNFSVVSYSTDKIIPVQFGPYVYTLTLIQLFTSFH